MMAPLGKKMNAMRTGAVDPASFAARATGTMASSNGKAMAVPDPLRNVRRGSWRFLLILRLLNLLFSSGTVCYVRSR